MTDGLILGREYLERVKDSVLYYPCSGNDLRVPIEMFSPYVTDFWFVDRGYFSSGHHDTRSYRYDLPADRQPGVLVHDDRYQLLDTEIRGPCNWSPRDPDIVPCVLSERYLHIESAREIRIHRRRGYGVSGFRKEIEAGKLGVFFYRGDSQGEGGSGNLWLSGRRIAEVCDKLIEGGLLVLDGSDGCRWRRTFEKGGVYKEFFQRQHEVERDPALLMASRRGFWDEAGRRFDCVGYAGMRYGPTMVWRLRMDVENNVLVAAERGAQLDLFFDLCK